MIQFATGARLYDVKFAPVVSEKSHGCLLASRSCLRDRIFQRKFRFEMKKKQSPKKSPKEHHISKAQKGNHEKLSIKRCVDPAVLALRKVSNTERPPTPYENENRASEQVLGPVFVPNKFMNGSQNYTQYARALPSASWPVNSSPAFCKVDGKTSNLSEIYGISKPEGTLASSLPAVDKKGPFRLSNEELRTTKRAPFLPKIDGNSKTKSASFHSVVLSDQGLGRSPQTSSEMIRLPPAKIHNGNITCKANNSPQLSTDEKITMKSSSSEDVGSSEIVPKPPSISKTKDKSTTRRKIKRRKAEDERSS